MTSTSLKTLLKMKEKREKIVMLTCYDASFSNLLNEAGIDVLLVGDTLGMTIQGFSNTVPVKLSTMVYHTRCVSQKNTRALLVSDLPFMSYATLDQALNSATQLMQAGAAMVKLEGGGKHLFDLVYELTLRGIPVCSHLGLTPQSVHQIGGYKVQGRIADQAIKIENDAKQLEKAGAALLVLECVPKVLAKRISESLEIPVIGIGAGPDCDGQVLVLYDILGLGESYTFNKNFLEGASSILDAAKRYVSEVKNGVFPAESHTFS